MLLDLNAFEQKFLKFQTANENGLIYIEVTFNNNTSDRRPIIHGDKERTNYVDIDFSRKALPLKVSDDD